MHLGIDIYEQLEAKNKEMKVIREKSDMYRTDTRGIKHEDYKFLEKYKIEELW